MSDPIVTPEVEDGLDMENMSDDDFLKESPASFGASVGPEGDSEDTDPVTDEELAKAQPEEEGAKPTDEAAKALDGGHTTPKQATPAPADPAKPAAPVAPVAAGEGEGAPPAAAEGEPPNYEALYKQIMAPFKANGKEFVPSSPEEVVRLAQMGANYTKKMQALQPNLKLMRMLENNGMLSPERISFMIDLDKKDPKAIQKLLHDSQLDPLDLDAAAEPSYKPGNHDVSDQEMVFHDILTDVASTPEGKNTIKMINDSWDPASKQAVYAEPKLLAIINEQRSNGIFEKINSEIERQRTLGQLTGVPFIQAYKNVGDQLHQAGKFAPPPEAQPAAAPLGQVPQTRQVLETRAAAPKAAPNGAQARAASPGPRTPAKTPSPSSFDPFEMTDEQIMAIQSPRI